MDWFTINNIDEIDSPSLVLYEDHLLSNLKMMIELVDGNTSRLMPHIKTNKMPEVIKRMIAFGIKKFKASTIVEAEMASQEGAEEVLIAHQLVGPKIGRFIDLIKKFPDTKFSTLVDNISSAEKLNNAVKNENLSINIFIDINSGMDRSGIKIGKELDELINSIRKFNNLKFRGLHVYDGHFRDIDFSVRNEKIEAEFIPIDKYYSKLKTDFPEIILICGGTPTFTSHILKNDRIASPGTCVFWDWSYDEKLTEQQFNFAVLIVTRVISKPTDGIITIDLGHKSVASENPIDKRIKFLNLTDYELLSQSEEHGVLRVKDSEAINVGDVFFAVPYHICPTVNLHEYVSVIQNHKKISQWQICRAR
ncbi:D-serine deaminase, pyridoxal phosphate-dependent [Flavobacteriaceae bacterium MAR_2010_188]|nr:D-serine deaminase, pyridoxal phosphate-dependent [Flavobacteriaceae bacterium MAR_2010_188]